MNRHHPSNPDTIGELLRPEGRNFLVDPEIGEHRTPPAPPIDVGPINQERGIPRGEFNERRSAFEGNSGGRGHSQSPNYGWTIPQPDQTTLVSHHSPATMIPAKVKPDLSTKIQNKSRYSAPFYVERAPKYWTNSPTDVDWKWTDSAFADLPFSSAYRKKQIENGHSRSIPKWVLIGEQLVNLKILCQRRLLKNSNELANAFQGCLKIYNNSMAEFCDFKILKRSELFEPLMKALPRIIDRCLELSRLLGGPVPLLQKGKWYTIYLTRRLCASFLANAFFATIPHGQRDPNELPHFHFLMLFHEGTEDEDRCQVKVEKIKCVLQYMLEVSSAVENGDEEELNKIISFERRHRPQKNNFQVESRLCPLLVNESGVIEDAEGQLQVDFANKFIGGGILSKGMVQEEIRFATCPDLIVSRLFTEVLGDDEVLVVTGAKRYSNYSGYGRSFRWKKLGKLTPLSIDKQGREMVQVVAMDALFFNKGTEKMQYQKRNIERELQKALVGFYVGRSNPHVGHVATGNWGCGAFNGDPQLKLIIQWLAASKAGRPGVVYFTFGDKQFSSKVKDLVGYLERKRVTIAKLYKALVTYENSQSNWKGHLSVFEHVKKCI